MPYGFSDIEWHWLPWSVRQAYEDPQGGDLNPTYSGMGSEAYKTRQNEQRARSGDRSVVGINMNDSATNVISATVIDLVFNMASPIDLPLSSWMTTPDLSAYDRNTKTFSGLSFAKGYFSNAEDRWADYEKFKKFYMPEEMAALYNNPWKDASQYYRPNQTELTHQISMMFIQAGAAGLMGSLGGPLGVALAMAGVIISNFATQSAARALIDTAMHDNGGTQMENEFRIYMDAMLEVAYKRWLEDGFWSNGAITDAGETFTWLTSEKAAFENWKVDQANKYRDSWDKAKPGTLAWALKNKRDDWLYRYAAQDLKGTWTGIRDAAKAAKQDLTKLKGTLTRETLNALMPFIQDTQKWERVRNEIFARNPQFGGQTALSYPDFRPDDDVFDNKKVYNPNAWDQTMVPTGIYGRVEGGPARVANPNVPSSSIISNEKILSYASIKSADFWRQNPALVNQYASLMYHGDLSGARWLIESEYTKQYGRYLSPTDVLNHAQAVGPLLRDYSIYPPVSFILDERLRQFDQKWRTNPSSISDPRTGLSNWMATLGYPATDYQTIRLAYIYDTLVSMDNGANNPNQDILYGANLLNTPGAYGYPGNSWTAVYVDKLPEQLVGPYNDIMNWKEKQYGANLYAENTVGRSGLQGNSVNAVNSGLSFYSAPAVNTGRAVVSVQSGSFNTAPAVNTGRASVASVQSASYNSVVTPRPS